MLTTAVCYVVHYFDHVVRICFRDTNIRSNILFSPFIENPSPCKVSCRFLRLDGVVVVKVCPFKAMILIVIEGDDCEMESV